MDAQRPDHQGPAGRAGGDRPGVRPAEPRRLELEVALDATPEQVWEAIATGPGISSWFVPTEVEPGEKGRIRQDFGSGYVVDGQVTAWEPGRRFGYGRFVPDEASPEQPDAEGPDYAFEFLVEGRAGGSTVLRFVQSGFLDGEGWDAEYDSLEHGWTLFFANLAAYLEHFAGRPVRSVTTMGFTALSRPEAWTIMHEALGLDGHPREGDEVRLTPEGLRPVDGVVDVADEHFLGVRTSDALFRFGAEGSEGCGVSAYHYFYRDDVDEAAERAAWHGWLSNLFPAPEPVAR